MTKPQFEGVRAGKHVARDERAKKVEAELRAVLGFRDENDVKDEAPQRPRPPKK